MDYFAIEIKDMSFKQIDKMTDEVDLLNFEQLRLDYPLIFFKREHSIIFFNIRTVFDQIQYDFLYQLVNDATTQKEQKGLSPIKLFELIKCRHIREKSRNKNFKNDGLEYDRANERMRDIKRRIKKDIKEEYDKLKNQLEKKIKKYEASGEINSNTLRNMNPIGIYEPKSSPKNKKYFNGSIEIGSDSPYYNFDIDSVIGLFIFNQRDKNKKYTTEFIFRNKR